MRLERIVRLKWRDVRVVELDRSTGERSVGIAALIVQTLARSKGSHSFIGLVVRFKVRRDVRFFSRVGGANGIGCGFGCLKRLRYSECNVLAVVANYIIVKRWPSLFANTGESWSGDRAKDLADISPIKNGHQNRAFLRRRSIQFCNLSVGDGRADGNSVKHSRKVKVGSVLCDSCDLAWTIHANRDR